MNSLILVSFKDCSGPFGLCTQDDKDKLGYISIKKLHEKMDDDRDGQIEIQETKGVRVFDFFFFSACFL